MSESADVALTTVTFMLVITSIVGNSLVCAVIMKNRDMRYRIPINYLLVNLAVADIVYSTFLIPELILSHVSTHPEGVTGKVLCTLVTGGTFAWLGAASSVVTLVAIATERYYAVIYPHGNKGKLTMRKLKVIIPGSWIFAFIIQLRRLLVKEYDKEKDQHSCILVWPEEWMRMASSLTWHGLVAIAFTVMVGLYCRVVYTLWFKRNGENELTYQQQGVLKVRKRVTLMLVTVSVIFGICWGTDLILHVLESVFSHKLSPRAIPIAHTMVMFNSAVNPFAYALINHRFREKIKRIICCSSILSAPRVRAAREPQGIELENTNARPTDTAETIFKESKTEFVPLSLSYLQQCN